MYVLFPLISWDFPVLFLLLTHPASRFLGSSLSDPFRLGEELSTRLEHLRYTTRQPASTSSSFYSHPLNIRPRTFPTDQPSVIIRFRGFRPVRRVVSAMQADEEDMFGRPVDGKELSFLPPEQA